MKIEPKLYVVPTPIGNLDDMTFRAIEVLKGVDLVLAEDTRDSLRLMRHFEIETPMQSYHLFNEHKTLDRWVERIAAGSSIALISDAGTPAISDPGFLLVRACVKADIAVECLPGATALIPALVDSALPCDRFCFEGFLPHKKGRQTKIQSLLLRDCTTIFYESPYRLVKALEQMIDILGPERKASVSREVSKLFEETRRGSLAELRDHFRIHEPKGEIVLIVAAAESAKSEDRQERDEADEAIEKAQ